MLAVAAPRTVEAQDGNRAGVVISFADGNTESYCVDFQADQISGYELLSGTGLAPSTEFGGQDLGNAVCGISGTGCTYPQNSCFCECTGEPCLYWSYWLQEEGAWTYSLKGSSSTTVRNGDVQGWSWSSGVLNSSANRPPPVMSFDDICSSSETPTATQSPTETATTEGATTEPTSTYTAEPTATWTWTPTRRPSTSTPTPVPATATPTTGPTPTPTNTPILPPTIRVFGADRSPIAFGESATILWDVVNANRVLLRYPGGEETVSAQGSKQVSPEVSTEYTIFAASSVGESEQTILVEVAAQFSAPTPAPGAAAAPAGEQPTATQTPIATNTPLPTVTPIPTETHTPIPTDTATSAPAAQSPLDASESAAQEAPAEIANADGATPTPIIVIVTATFTPESLVQATAPPVTLIIPGEAQTLSEPRSNGTERAFAASGILFVIGAPLLFVGIWLLVWYVMRRS